MNDEERFAVQQHQREGEPTHWDLMLQAGEILQTYRIAVPATEWGQGPMQAVRIFDHPLKFLSYEGSVNKGKGNVTISDSGGYRIIEQEDNRQHLEFKGTVLRGSFILTHLGNDTWELVPE